MPVKSTKFIFDHTNRNRSPIRKMKATTRLKFTTFLFIGGFLLQNCGSGDLPDSHCHVRWTLSLKFLGTYLFDYEPIDTIMYKRILNEVVTDTIVFTKQRNYKDVMEFQNGSVFGDEACYGNNSFSRERIGWDYKSQFQNIFFKVQYVAGSQGAVEELFNFKEDLAIVDLYYYQRDTTLITSELRYDTVYRITMHNKNEFDVYGQNDYKGRVQIDWTAFHNNRYGIVQISKNDGSEVWELIP